MVGSQHARSMRTVQAGGKANRLAQWQAFVTCTIRPGQRVRYETRPACVSSCQCRMAVASQRGKHVIQTHVLLRYKKDIQLLLQILHSPHASRSRAATHLRVVHVLHRVHLRVCKGSMHGHLAGKVGITCRCCITRRDVPLASLFESLTVFCKMSDHRSERMGRMNGGDRVLGNCKYWYRGVPSR